MDHKTFERRLAGMCLEFPKARTSEWERFPSMVGIYRSLARLDVPTQCTFAEKVASEMNRCGDLGVVARASRTYPSLVRQHHFLLVLREHFDLVVWDEDTDQCGVDLLVIDQAEAYGVALSTQTANARFWHGVKQERHMRPPIPTLDLWAEPNRYRVGPFWLHHPEQVEEVTAFVEHTRARKAAG